MKKNILAMAMILFSGSCAMATAQYQNDAGQVVDSGQATCVTLIDEQEATYEIPSHIKKVTIRNCPNLTTITGQDNSQCENFGVSNCDSLTVLPKELPNCTWFGIEKCHLVKEVPKELQN